LGFQHPRKKERRSAGPPVEVQEAQVGNPGDGLGLDDADEGQVSGGGATANDLPLDDGQVMRRGALVNNDAVTLDDEQILTPVTSLDAGLGNKAHKLTEREEWWHQGR